MNPLKSHNGHSDPAALQSLQSFLEARGDVLCWIDPEGQLTSISLGIRSLLGYLPDDLVGQRLSTIIAPGWRQPFETESTPEGNFHVPLIRIDGQLIWVELMLQPLADGAAFSGCRGLIHRLISPESNSFSRVRSSDAGEPDALQLRQAEDALRQSEERYRAVVEEQTELVCRYLPDTTLTFVNETYCEYFGLPRDQLIGRRYIDLIPEAEHEFIRHQIREAERKHYNSSVHGVLVNGQIRWQEWTDRAILDSRGEVIEFQSVGRDVTARKLMEDERNDYIHRLEIIQSVDAELTEQLNVDYVIRIALNAAVRISNADAGALHLLEDDHLRVVQVIGNFPETMIGMRWPLSVGVVGRVARLQTPELISDVNLDPDYVKSVIETRAQMTLPLISQDRLLGVLNVQTTEPNRFTTQMFDFLKLLTARIASALDNARLHAMTEKQLTELQALYQQVSDLEQMKTQMIRIAAHDLRNPLGVMSGYLQMMTMEMEPLLNDRVREHISIIRESIQRIDKITRDILTLERVSSGRGFAPELIDLKQIVATSFHEHLPQAHQKQLNYTIVNHRDSLFVEADRYMLPEAVNNLISNAIKYTPNDGRVEIRLEIVNKRAVLTIEDSGYGIPEDQQAQLFQPFFRVKSQETRSIKGTGLGLHLVRSIIERHQGVIRFSSVYGKGSQFGFELPLAKKSRSKKSRDS